MRTDGVHCRESAGTGPVNLKVVPDGYCLPWQITMDQLIFASLSHIHYWYEVGMLKVPAANINTCSYIYMADTLYQWSCPSFGIPI